MKLHKIYINKDGFTLIEILVVMAIFAILFGVGLFASMDFYRGYLLGTERDIAIGALEKARSRALSNMFESPHGVHIPADQKSFVIFRGTTYVDGAATNEIIPGNQAVIKDGDIYANNIVFNELTGVPTTSCSPECKLTLTYGARPPITISINNEGRIDW